MTKGLCSALSITESKSVSQLCHIHYFFIHHLVGWTN